MKKALAVLAVSGLAVAASADILVVDISGWSAVGGYAAAGNSFANFNLGVGTTIDAASYNVNWTAPSPSWSGELVLSLNDSIAFVGGFWDAAPGVGGAPGSESGSGPFNGAPGGVAGGPFVLTTGDLYVEIYDTFNDAGVDQIMGPGSTITIEYTRIPAPGALALLGVAGLVGIRRKRA